MSLFSSICNKTALKICCVLISGLLVSGSYAQPPNAGSDQPQPQKESRHRRARPQDPENQDPAQNQNPPAPNQPGQNQPQPGNPPGFAGNQKPGIPQASLEQLLQKAAPAEPVPLNQPDFVTEDQVQLKGTYYKGSASEETA
ncbi:MAG: hypothetical protein IKW74_04620, partial [Thermoguttaceae bacterium]|nr:hypothetical protein [Thermoguttaceae bacterium]